MAYIFVNIAMLVLVTVIQIFVPMAEGGRTFYSYIIPWFTLVFKSSFVLKTFGFPIPSKIPILGEAAVYFFTMFFFLSAYYKKGFAIYLPGIITNIVCVIVVVSSMLIEDTVFVYEHRERDNNI